MAETTLEALTAAATAARERLHRWRRIKDRLFLHSVRIGGIGVVVALVLIFFYLLYVVMPLLRPATAELASRYRVPAASGTAVHLAMEEQAEVAVRFADDGSVLFFHTRSGEPVAQYRLPIPPGVTVTSHAASDPGRALLLFGLSDGTAILARHEYEATYPNDVRVIVPKLTFPAGEAPLVLDEAGEPLLQVAIQGGEETTLVGLTPSGRISLLRVVREESFLGDEVNLEQHHARLNDSYGDAERLLLSHNQEHLYIVRPGGRLTHVGLSDFDQPQVREQVQLVEGDQRVTALEQLAGGISLLVGRSDGRVTQWFPVRDEQNRQVLTHIRTLDASDRPIVRIVPEFYRKAFVAIDDAGQASFWHATAERRVLALPLGTPRLAAVGMGPRANALLVEDKDGGVRFWRVHNEHPEVSMSSLWGKVWYEGYPEPAYIWQSSSASNNFEPKYSLTPLTFGTLKAAFYAMLIAMPLAILGAIYTAYFMAPRMRRMVKPTIEIMEALPTVILGFLAGLWLAPFVEQHLPGIFALSLLLPVGVLAVSWAWHRAPHRWQRAAEGWEGALLIPVIAVISVIALGLSPAMEHWLFGGDMRIWLDRELGLSFDQRNSIVVGLAMGFAVIPTIFSIAEDAIFNVPGHLTRGSLALGATPWQTLVRVVLLTASPGIFSALMIGLGRAVGETMIVLMATGNTPVMDMSIFQGMRTLSANIAVEMPESEVGSTHYRVLFLAALVLFVFTFIVNTGAELVRQRLRRRYASL